MKWMDEAWSELGQAEVKGKDANPAILAFFRDVGRPEVTSDEVSSCAAFVGACLVRSGISLDAIPVAERLLARSFLSIGTPITEPRIGAIAVWPRPDAGPWAGHVGFVAGWTATRIKLLGSNQGDTVSEKWFPRDTVLGMRWPEAPVAPGQIASRITTTASEQKKDVAKAAAVGVAGGAQPSAPNSLGVDSLFDGAGTIKSMAQTVESFALFAYSKLGWVLGAVALYYLLRIGWNSGFIQQLRAEDHNTGKNVGRLA